MKVVIDDGDGVVEILKSAMDSHCHLWAAA